MDKQKYGSGWVKAAGSSIWLDVRPQNQETCTQTLTLSSCVTLSKRFGLSGPCALPCKRVLIRAPPAECCLGAKRDKGATKLEV